ncbi:MAG TPA: PIN domain-containing protein, partial [Polyangiaceae bacterium]|nr:PIN domain-containing protein [Polyangiaceae bacterium]
AVRPSEPDHTAPCRLITLGPRAARRSQRIAGQLRLRAADAIYVWVALREDAILVTSDREIVARAASVCRVEGP